MEEREMYCDREPSNRSSWYILVYSFRYSKPKLLDEKEKQYLNYYQSLSSILFDLEDNCIQQYL